MTDEAADGPRARSRAARACRRAPAREIAGILKDVRGGHPHDHLVLNDEDDDRLALVRRLQGRSPGFPGETPIPEPDPTPVGSEAPRGCRLRKADFGERSLFQLAAVALAC